MDNAQVTQALPPEVELIVGEVTAKFRQELQQIMAKDEYTCLITGEAIEPWARQFLARHRLERSEPVGWMGIESAPRDGSVFFAWCPNVGRVIMNIDGVHRNTWAVDRTYRLGCNPTHWIPLPSAPGTTPPEPVAEIERLRDALRQIGDLTGEINPSNYDHEDACELNRQFCYALTVATAALGHAS